MQSETLIFFSQTFSFQHRYRHGYLIYDRGEDRDKALEQALPDRVLVQVVRVIREGQGVLRALEHQHFLCILLDLCILENHVVPCSQVVRGGQGGRVFLQVQKDQEDPSVQDHL